MDPRIINRFLRQKPKRHIVLVVIALGPLHCSGEAPMVSDIDRTLYWIVTDSGTVCVTDGLVEVAVTVTVDVVDEGDDPPPPQPVNMLSPITLAVSRSSICIRRRFLKPRKHNTAANIVPGNSGLEWRLRTAVVVGAVTVSVVVSDVVLDSVTLVGEKVHVAPAGNPEQAKVTADEKPFCPVTESVTIPLPPATMLTVEVGELRVKLGVPPMV
jgi:hypothetical protein